MTRALGTRSSKRKPAKSSQEIIPVDCENISPKILSQTTIKRTSLKNKRPTTMKENILPNEMNSKPVKTTLIHNKEVNSPVRKSTRHKTSSSSVPNIVTKTLSDRNVLGDKTNSFKTAVNNFNRRNIDVLQTVENQKNILHKIISVPDPKMSHSTEENSSDKNEISNENHVPVYRKKGFLGTPSERKTLRAGKNESVYEFEVDENEEPVQKKKRKKKAYVRKPKLGPKALTINNIKYSSTESLVSLPEKPKAQKKKTERGAKCKSKPCSSVGALTESEDSCYSVKSFMSHPPSLISRENRNHKAEHRLSILHETQSEQCTSPANVNLIDGHHSRNSFNSPVPPGITEISNNLKENNPPTSPHPHFSPNPRCYISKTSNKSNPNLSDHFHKSTNDTVQVSSYSGNTSVASTHNFLSSTPCKHIPLIVKNNSVFDDSCDLPHGMRPSTGFIAMNASASSSASSDHCFGFDEPEELEEPLVSPIKNNIDLVQRKPIKQIAWKLDLDQTDRPKPSAKEVIEMLKATIPKAVTKEMSDVYDALDQHHNSPSPEEEYKDDAPVTFKKPPRRSYERQRRIRRYSYHEEEEDESEKENTEEEKENTPQVVKKCYKKKLNSTKTIKPKKLTKSKQKAEKEEEELEKLAAQINAQFQKIDQVNLVVE